MSIVIHTDEDLREALERVQYLKRLAKDDEDDRELAALILAIERYKEANRSDPPSGEAAEGADTEPPAGDDL